MFPLLRSRVTDPSGGPPPTVLGRAFAAHGCPFAVEPPPTAPPPSCDTNSVALAPGTRLRDDPKRLERPFGNLILCGRQGLGEPTTMKGISHVRVGEPERVGCCFFLKNKKLNSHYNWKPIINNNRKGRCNQYKYLCDSPR